MNGNLPPQPSTITAQYETLRMAALGEALAPEARAGLMLLLRRGMWAWARAIADAKSLVRPRSPSVSTPSHASRAVIQLFAAMAINATNRSRP